MGSQVGGAIGGKANSPAQYAAPFSSPGGVTQNQQDLADYTYGQNLTESQAQFTPQGAGGGAGMSTMATQAATGAQIGKALNLGSMSDTDAEAEYKAYTVANQIQDINNTSEQTAFNQSVGGLSGLANLANQSSTAGAYGAGASSVGSG